MEQANADAERRAAELVKAYAAEAAEEQRCLDAEIEARAAADRQAEEDDAREARRRAEQAAHMRKIRRMQERYRANLVLWKAERDRMGIPDGTPTGAADATATAAIPRHERRSGGGLAMAQRHSVDIVDSSGLTERELSSPEPAGLIALGRPGSRADVDTGAGGSGSETGSASSGAGRGEGSSWAEVRERFSRNAEAREVERRRRTSLGPEEVSADASTGSRKEGCLLYTSPSPRD